MNTTVSTMSLEDMIAVGRYDWVNPIITKERFPIPEDLILGAEPKLYRFDPAIPSEEAIVLMNADGYRPATIFDLLDFGAKNPDEQRQYSIVGLGSVFRGTRLRRFVPLLDAECSGKRRLRFTWFNFKWFTCYRFLAVRTQQYPAPVS